MPSEASESVTERLPWCPECEAFAVPNDDSECGECGAAIVFKEGSR